jgi:hypothetical protein
MKKIFFIVFFLFFAFIVKAQQNYFVYIQTDNKQPFYVKLNNKVLSSSSTGYLVISKLNNGNYDLVIGFPKDQWPQQNLSFKIDNNDLGYNLKNFGEKGWGLFNIQSLEITMNNPNPAKTEKKQIENDDAFAAALNGKEVKKPIEKPVLQNKDEVKESNVPIVNTKPEVIKETIKKIKTINDIDGVLNTYVINDGKKIDTVTVFTNDNVAKSVIKEPVKAVVTNTAISNPKDTKFLDIELQNPNSTTAAVIPNKKQDQKLADAVIPTTIVEKKETEINVATKVATIKEPVVNTDPIKSQPELVVNSKSVEKELAPEEKKEKMQKAEASIEKEVTTLSTPTYINQDKPIVPFNSDCKNKAAEEDFKKIRKKMAAENTDADMIIAASKYFKTKCFTVEQVKNLSLLFLNDKGKYGFFDEAYPYTIDTNNFIQLQTQLHDVYYINRFKAMLGY